MSDFAAVIDVFTEWAWIGWLVLVLLFLVIEMLTLDFTFLMLSLGSAAGLVSGLFEAPLWVQFIVAGGAAALLILFLRPPLIRRLHRNEDPTKSNIDALVGLPGMAILDVSPISGQVKLSNGDIWTARALDTSTIAIGTPVTVVAIEGATAIVRPAHD